MKTLHITYTFKDKLKTIKTLFCILFFVAPLLLTAQTKTENYIKRTTYRAPSTQGITENDTLVSVTYFDGLGRLKQSVAVRAGGQGQDIVTPVVYDNFGRQTREYLPYTAATQNGNIHPDPMTEVENFYNARYGATPNPYSEKILENSPLGRVRKQGAPGTDWMADPASDTDHSIKFSYDANTSGEVRLYRVSLGPGYVPTLEAPGFYNPGTLYKTITTDENWQPGDGNLHTTEEFKDKRGRVVLKRTYADMPLDPGASHDTYYVYDKFSNLTFVIPPKVNTNDGVSPEELDELCYQYKYDHRNRLVEKKLPGKGWEFIVYNKLDQPVFTRDHNLLTDGQWLFTKYDKFGRVIYTGLYNSGLSREALQATMNGITNLYDTKTGSPTSIDGVDVYYDNSAFPNANIEVLTINYYDTYTFDLDGGTSEDSYGITPIIKPMMLATGNKTRIIGTDQWITTVLYYDKKGSSVYTYSRNDYLGVTDKVKTKLNFVGELLEVTTEHIKDGEASITAIEKFTYDPTGRLLKHTHQIAGHPEETLAENVYDELGQLVQKKVGNTPASPLQTIDYSYTIRGWLTGINNINSMGNDLFGFTIRYNDPEPESTPLYNGNISQTFWRTANVDNSLKNYVYSYDALNRITGAIDNTGNYNLNAISYDKNGNILSLNRQGHINEDATNFDVMDNLVYNYDTGNKLLRVEDTANDIYGFKDDAAGVDDTIDDYNYDDNGNMISDTNKGITGITYNHLNLPTEIIFNDDPSQKIEYFYTADGIKQQKVVTDNVIINTTDYAGAYIYENSSLKFVSHAEGYIEPDGGGGYDYVYQYKDQVNNIRLSYSDLNGDGSIDPGTEILHERNYYPFGMFHSGYNNAITGVKNNLKTYQDQEFTDDLELNIHEWKYRFSDPAIGRFWSIDPLADDYRYQSPYNFSENRVIDGFELEGLEYVTMHHTMNGNKHVSTTSTDYYRMTDKEINAVNGTPAGSYNAASYGPEGKGVKHVYHNRDASYSGPYADGKVRWDNRRVDFASRAGNHGLYSGAGSITKYGGSKDYNFDYQPVDWSDAIAKRHDEDYEAARQNADGPSADYIDDVNTYQADIDMLDRLDTFTSGGQVQGVDTPYRTTTSGEMELSIKGQKIVIGALAAYKKWKIDNNYGNSKEHSFKNLGQKFYEADKLNAIIIGLIYNNK